MPLRNTTVRWGGITQLFHWGIVALVLTQFVLALSADGAAPARKLALLARHKSIGITILALAALRLLWRWMNPVPPLPPTLQPWERRLAHCTHIALYALLFAVPFAGWLMSSAKNYPVSWFGLVQLPNFVAPSASSFHYLNAMHHFLGYTLAGVAVVHLLGALKHHFIYRDTVLRRMLPFTKVGVLIGVLAAGALPAAAHGAPRYMLDTAKSSLSFTFVQAGARTRGQFRKFTAVLDYGTRDLSGGVLSVTIDVDSVDTRDSDRDSTLRSADFFNAKRWPQATFVSSAITSAAPGRYDVRGALTIRDVTRELRLTLVARATLEARKPVVYLAGATTIHRLDFGVGQGDWQSTDWIGNEVTIEWSLRLPRAPPAIMSRRPAPLRSRGV
ncbi:MAG: YceI family protein [Steroidobacteraceae bacterium]